MVWGFWEGLIAMTKMCLKILGWEITIFASLQTIVMEVKAILYDRPLTCVPTGIDDPTPLTPAHLLYGRRMFRLSQPA